MTKLTEDDRMQIAANMDELSHIDDALAYWQALPPEKQRLIVFHHPRKAGKATLIKGCQREMVVIRKCDDD